MIPGSLRKKLQGEGGRQLKSADDFIMVHHILMREYGWIPLEEFRQLPLPTLWGLLDEIQKEKEAERKEMEKNKRK